MANSPFLTQGYVSGIPIRRDFLVFQLVRIDVVGLDQNSTDFAKNPTEIDVVSFPTIATGTLEMKYNNRASASQANNHFTKANAGQGIGNFTISGTFGGLGHADRYGLAYIDGYSALMRFKNRMFKASSARNVEEFNQSILVDDTIQESLKLPENELKDNQMLIVNMYDFDQKEYKQVELDSFSVVRDQMQGAAEKFTLSLNMLGPAIMPGSGSNVPWLKLLMAADRAYLKASTILNEGYTAILDNPALKILAEVVDGIEIFAASLDSIRSQLPATIATFTGKAVTTTLTKAPGVGGYFKTLESKRQQFTNGLVRLSLN